MFRFSSKSRQLKPYFTWVEELTGLRLSLEANAILKMEQYSESINTFLKQKFSETRAQDHPDKVILWARVYFGLSSSITLENLLKGNIVPRKAKERFDQNIHMPFDYLLLHALAGRYGLTCTLPKPVTDYNRLNSALNEEIWRQIKANGDDAEKAWAEQIEEADIQRKKILKQHLENMGRIQAQADELAREEATLEAQAFQQRFEELEIEQLSHLEQQRNALSEKAERLEHLQTDLKIERDNLTKKSGPKKSISEQLPAQLARYEQLLKSIQIEQTQFANDQVTLSREIGQLLGGKFLETETLLSELQSSQDKAFSTLLQAITSLKSNIKNSESRQRDNLTKELKRFKNQMLDYQRTIKGVHQNNQKQQKALQKKSDDLTGIITQHRNLQHNLSEQQNALTKWMQSLQANLNTKLNSIESGVSNLQIVPEQLSEMSGVLSRIDSKSTKMEEMLTEVHETLISSKSSAASLPTLELGAEAPSTHQQKPLDYRLSLFLILLEAKLQFFTHLGYRFSIDYLTLKKGFLRLFRQETIKETDFILLENFCFELLKPRLDIERFLELIRKYNYPLEASIQETTRNNPPPPFDEIEEREAIPLIKKAVNKASSAIEQAESKPLVAFLGGTGAGKSTTLNFCLGAKYEAEDSEHLTLRDTEAGMRLAEVGDEYYVSKTEFAEIFITAPLVYCDFPGYHDTRGKINNLANAMNTHFVLSRAQSIRLVFLTEYDGLSTDYGRKIKEIAFYIRSLFGDNDEIVQRNRGGILIGITKCRDESDFRKASKQLTEFAIVNNPPWLAENIIWVKADKYETRDSLLAKIQSLNPLTQRSDFHLTVSDEDKLHCITLITKISNKLEWHLHQSNFKEAKGDLSCINYFRGIGGDQLTTLYDSALEKVRLFVADLSSKIREKIDAKNDCEAKLLLKKFANLTRKLQGFCDFSENQRELENAYNWSLNERKDDIENRIKDNLNELELYFERESENQTLEWMQYLEMILENLGALFTTAHTDRNTTTRKLLVYFSRLPVIAKWAQAILADLILIDYFNAKDAQGFLLDSLVEISEIAFKQKMTHLVNSFSDQLEKLIKELIGITLSAQKAQLLSSTANTLENFLKVLGQVSDNQQIIKTFAKINSLPTYLSREKFNQTQVNFLEFVRNIANTTLRRIAIQKCIEKINNSLKNNEFSSLASDLNALSKEDHTQLSLIPLNDTKNRLKREFQERFKREDFSGAKHALSQLLMLMDELCKCMDFLAETEHAEPIDLQNVAQEIKQEFEAIATLANSELRVLARTPSKIPDLTARNFESFFKAYEAFHNTTIGESLEQFKVDILLQFRQNFTDKMGAFSRPENIAAISIVYDLIRFRAFALKIPLTISRDSLSFIEAGTKNLIKRLNQQHFDLFQRISIHLKELSADETVGQFATELIKLCPEFSRIDISLFNAKAGKTPQAVFGELEKTDLECNLGKLKEAYGAYKNTYDAFIEQGIRDVTFEERRNETRRINEQIEAAKKTAKALLDSRAPFASQSESLGKLVGAICSVWSSQDLYRGDFQGDRQTLSQPHPTQVISIFLMLGVSDAEFKNRLLEVGTGEGKSITLAIAAITLSLLGHEVTIACYNDYLALRDSQRFNKLFEAFRLTDKIRYRNFSNLIEEKILSKSQKHQEAKPPDVMKALLENDVRSIPEKLPSGILMIDEVDVFFGENFLTGQYWPGWELEKEAVSLPFDSLVKEMLARPENYPNTPETQDSLKSHPAILSMRDNYPGLTETLIDDILKKLLSSLEIITQTDSNADKPTYAVHPTLGVGEYEAFSGNFKQYMSFDYQLAHLKEAPNYLNWPPKTIFPYLDMGIVAFSDLPNHYRFVLGTSATLSTLTRFEREALLQYRIGTQHIGTQHKVPSPFKKQPDRACETKVCPELSNQEINGYFYNIKTCIEQMVRAGRAILVVFETEERLRLFERYVLDHRYTGLDNVKTNILLPSTPVDIRDGMIASAATKNQVTLMTKNFGRGSDFICNDPALIERGGVHVLQTFFSENMTEETQIRGRTRRQDNPGSFSLILYLEDLEKFGVKSISDLDSSEHEKWYDYLKTEREKSLEKNYEAIEKKRKAIQAKHQQSQRFFRLAKEAVDPNQSATKREESKKEALRMLENFQRHTT